MQHEQSQSSRVDIDPLHYYFPLHTRRITNDGPSEIEVMLEGGPCRGEIATQVPSNAVTMFRPLDDGSVVRYDRWEDNVWRFNAERVT